jgi:hypothetical protein
MAIANRDEDEMEDESAPRLGLGHPDRMPAGMGELTEVSSKVVDCTQGVLPTSKHHYFTLILNDGMKVRAIRD